jgi:hypothetical protein
MKIMREIVRVYNQNYRFFRGEETTKQAELDVASKEFVAARQQADMYTANIITHEAEVPSL